MCVCVCVCVIHRIKENFNENLNIVSVFEIQQQGHRGTKWEQHLKKNSTHSLSLIHI